MSKRYVRATWATLVAAGLASACSMTASQVPLDNERPEGPEVYFYGPADRGGKKLRSEEAEDEPRKPVVLPKPPSLVKPKKVAKADEKEKKTGSGDAGVEAETESAKPASWAGRYAGTDTVVVSFPGVPTDPQVDDKAKMDVVRLGDTRLSVAVIDSQRGVPLCTVEGDVAEGKIELDEGQECFSDMLGIPVDTSLLGGSGSIEGDKLTIEFEVEMSIDTPSGTIEGGIDYHFVGTKTEGANGEKSEDEKDDE